MSAVSDEPALSFWLSYVEREGALVEDAADHALLLLPEPLQHASELPEEVVVTADPDVAREDGAVLLIAGHPALDKAANAVLAEGDVGSSYLAWPGSRPPARSTLEARARELVPVEHGRIDAAGEPAPSYLPLLRVGAMIGYAASLTLRFQEQEEAWVDARTGLALPERTLAKLRARTRLDRPDAPNRALVADVSLALPAAHEQLERRAAARKASLAAHARRTLESELMRADAYFDAALEGIARRRVSASADRAGLLDGQAQATEAERARRRREIEDEFTPRHEITPFRLHLVHVPAFVLAVTVRRGNRSFPFELAWIAGADEFAAVRCPACGTAATLVAGREKLGCEACVASAVARRPGAGPPAAEQPRPVPEPTRLDEQPPASRERRGDAPAGRERRADAPASRSRATPARPPARRPGPASARADRSDAVERTGNKLALGFWQTVASGERWPRSKLARDSPLRALYRLYGDAGPRCALGIPPDEYPAEVTASTHPQRPGAVSLTSGAVLAGGEWYRFSLFWQFQAGKPTLGEVMPAPHPLALPPARGELAELSARLRESAPAPAVVLDPVAAILWRAELDRHGLPCAVRCLATWWRVQDHAAEADPPEALAAAVAGAVARAAGMRRGEAEAVATYAADAATVQCIRRELGGRLELDRERGW